MVPEKCLSTTVMWKISGASTRPFSDKVRLDVPVEDMSVARAHVVVEGTLSATPDAAGCAPAACKSTARSDRRTAPSWREAKFPKFHTYVTALVSMEEGVPRLAAD